MDEVGIGAEGIRLGQLVKLVGWADTGGVAKQLLASGEVTVNGRPESRRGTQLSPGEVVAMAGQQVRIVAG